MRRTPACALAAVSAIAVLAGLAVATSTAGAEPGSIGQTQRVIVLLDSDAVLDPTDGGATWKNLHHGMGFDAVAGDPSNPIV